MDIKRLVSAAFPNRRVISYEILAGGLVNTNLKIHFESGFKSVVRLYRDGAAACRKEAALYTLLQREVPLAEIFHVEREGLDGSPPFAVLEFVEGLTFQQLKRTGDLAAIQQASTSAGETLAAIGRFQFRAPGELLVDEATNKLIVGNSFIDGPDPIPRILDRFLASPVFQRRANTQLIDRLHNFVWTAAPALPQMKGARNLVHNDFGNRNILVREVNGTWRVAAVLDWELAISGSPLLDVGHFLRYDHRSKRLCEPFFSRAFVEHGGHLPENWEFVVKVIDLTGLVECLTHEELPADVETELFALVDATLAMA